jgi:hypothetical protein
MPKKQGSAGSKAPADLRNYTQEGTVEQTVDGAEAMARNSTFTREVVGLGGEDGEPKSNAIKTSS